MRVFNDLQDLPDFQNAVITIGSFDGVHSGHQQILEKVNQLAKRNGGESIVITFHPHPRQVVYPKDNSLELITTTEEKVALFERYQVDNVVVVPFTVEFSQQSADEYIQNFLVAKFKPKHIVIGYDHRFGLNRQGDINYLKWHSEKFGYEVVEIARQDVQDIAVSSTKIREALNQGNVEHAARYLKHYFSLSGKVVAGQRIGTKIGFPTANLLVEESHKLIPPDGIYAVFARHRGKRYKGMLYIGKRPTLKDLDQRMIEVNIFEFDQQVYGERIQLELVARTRGDQSFSSLDELSEQLTRDKKECLAILDILAPARQSSNILNRLPSVAVVILNFNTSALLKKFLPSVLTTKYPFLEVIVADNGSQDDSIEVLREEFPDVRLICLEKNLGFAGGYNAALQEVEADYFVLLNSDVEVTEDWLTPLIREMEKDREIAVAQPKILSYREKDQFEYAGAAGGWMDHLGYPFCRGRIFQTVEKDTGQYDTSQEVFWASGAAFCIRSRLYKALGGFDADFFAHLEEIDLCWRLKRAGYKIFAVPAARVYHLGGGTLDYQSPRKTYLNFRNSLYTLTKNLPQGKRQRVILARLLMDGLAAMLFLMQGKVAHIRAILRAHRDFYPKIKTLRQKRRASYEQIQKVSIRTEANLSGTYRKSIVWQYYVKGRKLFRNLPKRT